MTLTKTPICDFGKKADFFELKSIENKLINLNDIKGKNGTLIMFICNHCPYVKAVIDDIVDDCKNLEKEEIKKTEKTIEKSEKQTLPAPQAQKTIKEKREVCSYGGT